MSWFHISTPDGEDRFYERWREAVRHEPIRGFAFTFFAFDDLRTAFEGARLSGALNPSGWHNRCLITGREPAAPRKVAPSGLLRQLLNPDPRRGAW
jgi:hypothetical protein